MGALYVEAMLTKGYRELPLMQKVGGCSFFVPSVIVGMNWCNKTPRPGGPGGPGGDLEQKARANTKP